MAKNLESSPSLPIIQIYKSTKLTLSPTAQAKTSTPIRAPASNPPMRPLFYIVGLNVIRSMIDDLVKSPRPELHCIATTASVPASRQKCGFRRGRFQEAGSIYRLKQGGGSNYQVLVRDRVF